MKSGTDMFTPGSEYHEAEPGRDCTMYAQCPTCAEDEPVDIWFAIVH